MLTLPPTLLLRFMQYLLCCLQATLQGAQRKQQELLTCLEAMRMLAQEHGQELDRSMERARRCRVELRVEQHRWDAASAAASNT
jgi:hypothetical protein